MFLHIFYTWVIANILHPFFMLLWFYLTDGDPIFSGEIFQLYFLILMYSLLFSLPCLLLGWLCLYLITTASVTTSAKFLTWLFIAPILVFLEILMIFLFYGLPTTEELLFALPGIAAVVVAILGRFKQFHNLINVNQTSNYETDLV